MGLLALYKDGPGFEVLALDSAGHPRADWAVAIRRRPLHLRSIPEERFEEDEGPAIVRRLGALLEAARRPVAVAALVVRPAR